MSPGKKKEVILSAEKMALLAENGLNKARLSRAEKIALAEDGLDELYTIKESLKTPVSPIDPQLVEKIMNAYFPSKVNSTLMPTVKEISVQLSRSTINVVKNFIDWQIDSPLFAKRGDEPENISFFKSLGNFTIHFEITKDSEQRSCITVILTDSLNKKHSFEAALFQNEQCIESIHVNKKSAASFSGVLLGDYSLRVFHNEAQIVAVNIRLEK